MGVRLPSAYQEVEYLEATGTQYIQTSYTPQNADEVVCDFALVSSITGASNAQALFSAGTGTNQLIFLLNNTAGASPVDGAYYKYFASGNAARLFFYPSYDTKYRLEIGSDGTANCNGYSVQSHYEGTVNTALRLMQRANGGSSFKGKCYQFILSNGGEVKLHLIPCYRKSDDEPGMYDLVTKEFFTNAGTGEFLVGPDVIDSISSLMVAWRMGLMQNVKPARLPREYQEVEYIEGTGTQYININSTDQRYEMECECLFPSSRTNGAMLWGGSSFSDSDAWALFQSYSTLTLRRRNNGNSDCSLSNNVYINKKIHVELFESHCRFSDEDGEVLAEKVETKQKQYPAYMQLFHGYSNGGYSTRYVSARLYWMKVYINGTLVYHLIPCYRKEDGEIGVYDLINNRFNANNGTGVFLKGINV